MKSKKKFVLAGLALLAIVLLLPLAGCKNDTVPEPPTYTVTFNSNGGSAVTSQKVESGQKATKPADPTKDGWAFQSWYEDSGLTKEFNFSTPVTADTPLYAKWWANPGTVVSDGIRLNGGELLPKTCEVQVLSTAVDLSNLYKDGVASSVFISGRSGTIDPFVMGQYEVTQQLYLEVMGSKPSHFQGESNPPAEGETQELRPVELVSWYDAVVFCNRLSQLTGLEPAYSKGGQTDTSTWGVVPISSDSDWNAITCKWDASGYRLPTEAEWELAARGGDPEVEAWKYPYAGGGTIDGVAWYSGNSGNKTHQVGTKAGNSLNLRDMSGNVREWCWDWYVSSIAEDTPSTGGVLGSYRVYRGGSWYNGDDGCSVSYRNHIYPYNRYNFLGFRVVRPSSK